MDEDTIQSLGTNTTYAWTGWKISTAGAFTTASSRKVKRDITPVVQDGLLEKLESIEFVNYKMKPPTEDKLYKNGKIREKYKKVNMGCIAEDIKLLFPECVERENNDAIWMLNYTDLSLFFNKGVQELIKRDKEKQVTIEAIALAVATLEKEKNDLTARLERLEKLLIPV